MQSNNLQYRFVFITTTSASVYLVTILKLVQNNVLNVINVLIFLGLIQMLS